MAFSKLVSFSKLVFLLITDNDNGATM